MNLQNQRMKILFVCLGNICRSPLADGILRRKAKELGVEILVDSAGTAAYHVGNPPDARMIETARQKGTDISFLRARKFTQQDFEEFDQIYVMDQENYMNVIDLARNEDDQQKVNLILNVLYEGEDREVPDPYYGGQEGFELVYDLLDQATEKIIERINN